MTVFGKYARYYNLLYRDKDYQAEADYVDSLIRQHCHGARTIADFGCGTGNHDFLFAQKGYLVDGVDLSVDMIAEAKARLASQDPAMAGRMTFRQGNIQEVRLGRVYDVVLSLFHVMSYQTTNEALYASLKNAHDHLRSGGICIFDFWYGPAVLTDPPEVRTRTLQDDTIYCRRIARPMMHANENTVDVNYEIVITEKDTGGVETLTERHTMRYLFLPELMFLLDTIGFRLQAAQQWMNKGVSLSFSSWNGVLVVSKS